jgi:drug/metabolite transporter (DMT)-like permease
LTVAHVATDRTRSRYLQGIALIGLFVLLSSAREVYVGHLVQKLHPFLVVCFCFAVATIVFTALHLANGGGRVARAHLGDIVRLNIATAFAWIGSFYALRFVEPSIVNSIVTAVGPAITILAGVPMGQRREILVAERVSSVAIVGVIAFMAAITLLDRSGVGNVSSENVAIGLGCCLVAGAGVVGSTIFAKRLGAARLPATLVLAVRFHLLIVVSALMVLSNPPALDAVQANLPGLLVLATAGITLPLYFLQKGIERSEPITVSFLLVLAPALVYLFQVFDARLSWSGFTLAGITAVMGLVLYSLIARHRSIR